MSASEKKSSLAQLMKARTNPTSNAENQETSSKVIAEQYQENNIDNAARIVDISLIDVEKQIRQKFDMEYIESLAKQIAASDRKMPDTPIKVWQRSNGRLLLDDGENRYRAMKFAAENRASLGVNDLSAFTSVNVVIRGDEPNKTVRTVSQWVANEHDELYDFEKLEVLTNLMELNAGITLKELAEMLNEKNVNTSVSNFSRMFKASKECDADILAKFNTGEYSARQALSYQAQKDKQKKKEAKAGITDSEASSSTISHANDGGTENSAEHKRPKKRVTMALDIESVEFVASHFLNADIENLTRKELKALFDIDSLKSINGE